MKTTKEIIDSLCYPEKKELQQKWFSEEEILKGIDKIINVKHCGTTWANTWKQELKKVILGKQ